MGNFNRINSIKESYRKIIKSKPYIEEAIIIGGVCFFAIITAVSLKFMSEEKVDMDIKLNPNEESYYSANYDAALKQYKINGEKDKWPLSEVKEAEIYSLKGDKLNSNVKLSNAYIERNKIISEEGAVKYVEKDKALGNYLSFTYLMNGEVEKAIEYGEDFLKSNSDNNDLRETLVVAYSSLGDNERAKSVISEYKESDNSFDISKKAELNIFAGNIDLGIIYLRSAFEKNKNEIRILDLIDNQIKANNLEFINEIQRIKDENSEDDIANLVLKRKDLIENNENAKKIVDTLKNKNDKNIIEDKMILDYVNYEEEKELVSKIIDNLLLNHTDDYGANYILGEYYLKVGNINKALEYGKKSVNLKEDYSKNYGFLFPEIIKRKDEKNLDKIAPYLRRGLYYEPFDISILNNTAKYYEEALKDTNMAYYYYDLICKVSKNDSNAFYNLAKLNSRREEKKLAIDNISKAIELDSENVDYYNLLGVIYFKFDDPDKGMKEIKKAYKLDKNNVQTLNNAAVYYAIYAKDINRAMENMETAYKLSMDLNDLILKSEIESNYKKIKKNYDLYKDEKDLLISVDDLNLIV